MDDLSAFVRNGFDRIRRGQDPYQPTQETGLSKGLAGRIESHFTAVNNSIALRKASQFLQGVDDPTEDEEVFTRKRLAAGRDRSRSEGHDPDLDHNQPQEDQAPAYGDAEEYPIGYGPEWCPPSMRRVGPARDTFEALVGEAAERARRESRGAGVRVERPQARSRKSS